MPENGAVPPLLIAGKILPLRAWKSIWRPVKLHVEPGEAFVDCLDSTFGVSAGSPRLRLRDALKRRLDVGEPRDPRAEPARLQAPVVRHRRAGRRPSPTRPG